MVRRNIGETREEDTRHFLGKMKKKLFSLEIQEKNVTLHSYKRRKWKVERVKRNVVCFDATFNS